MSSLEYTNSKGILYTTFFAHTLFNIMQNSLKVDDVIRGHDIMHVQMIMGNGIIVIPPHNLTNPSHCYYQL
jgi:hypothetical protein